MWLRFASNYSRVVGEGERCNGRDYEIVPMEHVGDLEPSDCGFVQEDEGGRNRGSISNEKETLMKRSEGNVWRLQRKCCK